MYLAYTYFIKNKITGQFYYGSRYRNIKFRRTPHEDFWIYYFTSSHAVKALVEQYGKESFITDIVFTHIDPQLCFWEEQRLIRDNINNSLCLNRYYVSAETNGKTFSSTIGLSEKEKETIKKKRIKWWSDKTPEERKLHIDKILAGQENVDEKTKRLGIEKCQRSRTKHIDEIGKLISQGHKNRTDAEQEKVSANYSTAQKIKYQNLTEEEKDIRRNKISDSVKLMHQQRTQEEKLRIAEKRRLTLSYKKQDI